MVKTRLQNLISETAERLGYSVYDSTIYLKGENTRLTVKIDRVEGVSHDDCGEYSRELVREIEHAEIVPKFSLEVSSPGFKREVRNIPEFERFKGAPVKIVFSEDGATRVAKGRIVSVEDEIITIEEEKNMIKILYKNISKANLDY